eukprot:46127-Alexandrium_andersonii.AAC.1
MTLGVDCVEARYWGDVKGESAQARGLSACTCKHDSPVGGVENLTLSPTGASPKERPTTLGW